MPPAFAAALSLIQHVTPCELDAASVVAKLKINRDVEPAFEEMRKSTI